MKRNVTIVLLVALLLALAGAALAAPISPARANTIILKPQQSIMIRCVGGDELIIAPVGLEAEIACRVWVR